MHRNNKFMSLFVSFATFCIMTLCRSTLALPPTTTISRPISILPAPPALKIPTKKPTKKPTKNITIKPIHLNFPTKKPTIVLKFPTKKPVPTAPVVFMPFVFDSPTIKPAPTLPSVVPPTYEPIPIPKRE